MLGKQGRGISPTPQIPDGRFKVKRNTEGEGSTRLRVGDIPETLGGGARHSHRSDTIWIGSNRDRKEGGHQGGGFDSLSGSPDRLLDVMGGAHAQRAARLTAEHVRPWECRAPKIYG